MNENPEQLLEISKAVRKRFQYLDRKYMMDFNIGDKVKFKNSSGMTVHGELYDKKVRYVIVKTQTGRWKVNGSVIERE